MDGYYFRLPAVTQLTISQQAAVDETEPIALSGGPGTGKSVVSLWRHISNYNLQNRVVSLLLTYTTTLKQYLKACCNQQSQEASNNVGTLFRNKPVKKWDEIVVDEAQDVSNDYYQEIKNYGVISYGADDSQILYPEHCSTQAQLQSMFSKNVMYVLDQNFRNTQRIMQFAKIAFPNANIPKFLLDGLSSNIGEKPVLIIAQGEKQDNAIERIINAFIADDHNIAILVPSQKDVRFFDAMLFDKGIEHSIYYSNDSVFPKGCGEIKNIHITTFKSAKGLEFDTVIIPNFNILNQIPIYESRFSLLSEHEVLLMKNMIDELEKCRKAHDEITSIQKRQDGKYYVAYRKLRCSWEDLYVACTRTRSNLYLISNCDFPQFNTVTEKDIL